jgi:hypothetical protein
MRLALATDELDSRLPGQELGLRDRLRSVYVLKNPPLL